MTLPHTHHQPTLRVVHSVPGSWLPITQNWLYNQVHHLPADVESHIVCQRRENEDVFPTPNVHALDDQPRLTQLLDKLARATRLRRHCSLLDNVISVQAPDVLHSHFGNVACNNLALARKYSLPHVVTFYGLDVNYLPQRGWLNRYQRLFAEIDLVLCEGPHMASCLVDLGCPTTKVQVQRLGVRIEKIPFQPLKWNGNEPLRILLAAEFREKKGLPYALDAIGKFRAHTNTPVEITIIGDDGASQQSQTEKQRIYDTIARHNLDNNVRMLGRQPYARILTEAVTHHVFMHPSVTATDGQTEGGAPIVLLDMAAVGISIISSQHCDIPEIITPGITGLLADERDINGLADQLEYFTQHPDQCVEMACRAREHVEHNFNAHKQGPILAAHYQHLLGLSPLSFPNPQHHEQLRHAA